MNPTALMERNGFSKPASAEPKPPSWLHQTTYSFFSSINWDDNPPEVEQVRLDATSSDGPLSLMLTVRQFFTSVNWDGASSSRAIAPEVDLSLSSEPPQPAANAFTLEDFSDLF
ncbi:hypothetical protein P7L53_17085 [Thermoleptolyngbya sichuanensis XZ-Cy5]|uniref:hypothetical protein n=1 Tax=Thermoleptolyngbya sichuanensis TaxID=2885951 RepID=UPI00240DA8E7|nr:hypothetical protein [Thermoleptolyngbya sichuanensis]MDG2617958.1 hypothetical protein [Thermoleptolyngbya sichuanensis XZ-Cy5]